VRGILLISDRPWQAHVGWIRPGTAAIRHLGPHWTAGARHPITAANSATKRAFYPPYTGFPKYPEGGMRCAFPSYMS